MMTFVDREPVCYRIDKYILFTTYFEKIFINDMDDMDVSRWPLDKSCLDMCSRRKKCFREEARSGSNVKKEKKQAVNWRVVEQKSFACLPWATESWDLSTLYAVIYLSYSFFPAGITASRIFASSVHGEKKV